MLAAMNKTVNLKRRLKPSTVREANTLLPATEKSFQSMINALSVMKK